MIHDSASTPDKHNISALSDKQLKYLTSTLLQWIGLKQALVSSAKIHVS